jgi:hypothetical protein
MRAARALPVAGGAAAAHSVVVACPPSPLAIW